MGKKQKHDEIDIGDKPFNKYIVSKGLHKSKKVAPSSDSYKKLDKTEKVA